MAPKPKSKRREISQTSSSTADRDGMFSGMTVFLVRNGVQPRRFQIWKEKLEQMGGKIEESLNKKVTHVLTANSTALLRQLDKDRLSRFKGTVLVYQWLEDCLKSGEKLSEDLYKVKDFSEGENVRDKSLDFKSASGDHSSDKEPSSPKKPKLSAEEPCGKEESREDSGSSGLNEAPSVGSGSNESPPSSLPYSPPDLNRNITEIFGKLINIYRALGEDRRSFSYYKAIGVIEKLPFRIESADQVKDLPTIGKSMKDHIQEIVTTGKLSKLEHFEKDEKVKTISLFGEVWGIGPATALKLYEKGYRTLDDLRREDSLTKSQKIGLQYFHDIQQRIPRHEVEEMERLLQKAGEELLPGVIIVCGGSYRRGKASCGDMDIIITHPDGKSHKGFLSKYVKHLKETGFLREDLVFSIHSEEDTDSGVDTYFGLCAYPGRELRHRIDLKVYPRDIYAFGLVAWTGNDVLNRRLRLLAESKGFRLDDTGLFPATKNSSGKRGARAIASLKFNTEKELFDFLGFPWLEPHERNL